MSAGGIDRRALLGAGAVWLAAPRLARAAEAATPAHSAEAILAASGLAGRTGYALVDLDSGALVEGREAGVGRPPASVAKLVTTLYALDALGAGFRFRTAVIAAGPVAGGVVQGDLALVGGGDPVLDTDMLAGLVQAMAEAGVRGATGRLLVAGGALPVVARIDGEQPEDAAYNPTISGINLNFNRVFLGWQAGGKGLAFSAPGERFEVPAAGFRAELVAEGPPRHRMAGGAEVWSLPRDGVRRRGSVWLPVRAPEAYAGMVMRGLGPAAGVKLPPAVAVAAAPAGGLLALRESAPLGELLREMLLYSTNLTAEVTGLRASQARGVAPGGLEASAAAMTAWARGRFGLAGMRLVNHSGLSGRSAVAPAEMAALLRQAEGLGLPALMKPRPIQDARGQPLSTGVAVLSKTGTMDFVSALAGYMTGGRRRLGFAIMATDPDLRARIRPEERDDPPGSDAWAKRAKAQEQALLRRWATLYAG